MDNKYEEIVCENGHSSFILKSTMRKYKAAGVTKKHKCKQCLTEKRIKEAENVGITLLEEVGKDYGIYKLSCGCTARLRHCHVKINNFICVECRDRKQKLKEESFGLTAIERIDYKITKYHRQECGHILEMNRDFLSGFCKVCQEEKYAKEAEENGLEIISEVKEGYRYRMYRFKACGHTQIIARCNVKTGNFKCQQCHDYRLEQEASSVGLTIVGKSTDNKNRLYLAECGHILDIQTASVRSNEWTCHICKDTYILKPNNLYLLEVESLEDGFKFLKFGFSRNVEKRITSYGAKCCKTNILKVLPVPTGEVAHILESKIHSNFKSHNLEHGKMRDYLVVSGFTECYGIELKDAILNEIEIIEEELNA